MFGSEMLEVTIGLVLLFLIISFVCTAIRESIEAVLKQRAKQIERGILGLVGDSTTLASLYKHPAIFGLYAGGYRTGSRSLPSYIPARNFASALLDLAQRGQLAANTAAKPPANVSLATSIDQIGDGAVKTMLRFIYDSHGGDIERMRAELEAWYDSAMDRVSGWYKRHTQGILFGLGLAIAGLFNIDAIAIGQHLGRNDALRQSLVAEAERVSVIADTDARDAAIEKVADRLETLGLPIGWAPGRMLDPLPQRQLQPGCATNSAVGTCSLDVGDWLMMLLGWAFTAFAVTLGAPFWFDVLNKIMVIRSTVKPHEKSPEEGSEDRQRKGG